MYIIERSIFGIKKLAQQSINRIFPGPLILMYHRIAQDSTDPWSMCVTQSNFAEHLKILRRLCRPMKLNDLLQNRSTYMRRAVAITFDDGYANNLINAKPILKDNDIPATIFVTVKAIGAKREFWWDELDRIFLQTGVLPTTLELDIGGKVYQWALGKSATYSRNEWMKNMSWRIRETAPSSRHEVYRSIWSLMRNLSPNKQNMVVSKLSEWAAQASECRETHRLLAANELLALKDSDIIEIGSHAMTHRSLNNLPTDLLCYEIYDGKKQLEEILECRVNGFSYPHGLFSTRTINFVREAGFRYACSAMPAGVRSYTDCFKTPRLHVRNWNGRQFEKFLSAWLPK